MCKLMRLYRNIKFFSKKEQACKTILKMFSDLITQHGGRMLYPCVISVSLWQKSPRTVKAGGHLLWSESSVHLGWEGVGDQKVYCIVIQKQKRQEIWKELGQDSPQNTCWVTEFLKSYLPPSLRNAIIQEIYCEMNPLVMSEPLYYTMHLLWGEFMGDVRALMIWKYFQTHPEAPSPTTR